MDQLWEYAVARRVPRSAARALSAFVPFRGTDLSEITAEDRAARLWLVRSRGLEITTSDGVPRWHEAFRDLVPVPAIADRIRSVFETELRGRPYVGIQVRTHAVSHAKTALSSPVEWFAARMRAIREEHPDALFFLSCDTPEAQGRLTEEFAGCVALEGKGGYNSIDGVRSSIVDLYLLAAAQHLVGASHSSFVEMAMFLNGGIVPFERPTQPLGGPVDLSLGEVEDPLRPSARLTLDLR
ncbi:hypothetical protein ABID70_002402 [Clavibacter michiganensis]|uniref:hypothetical protein n=1 Tax=Clavibacter michiganensis TaxID=28447 RepID=UPI001AE0EDEA|nr:hypothetical protein [Clavibacter michiganensis]MBP2456878.1 hypothetical protein [Clavibacter michiganensis]MDQ0409448.1 hypothetical protein [Clavibacter michiganensis]